MELEKDRIVLNEYISFLLKNELIHPNFTITENVLYPKLDKRWDYPGRISNFIFDASKYNEIINLTQLFLDLEVLNCRYVQFRNFEQMLHEQMLHEFLRQTTKSSVIGVELFLPSGIELNKLINLVEDNKKIKIIVIFNSERDELIYEGGYGHGKILGTCQRINTKLNCGQVQMQYMSCNIKSFTEAQHHNTCLNRKISIDTEGNIKNCPSMSQSFGNIKDTTLQEALDHPDFKKYWNIKKDDITKCKDCEFRYICTDCRAYIDDPEDIYSAPLKCGYDPYKGVWEEWSTNPLKQKAIDFYGMREIWMNQ